MPAHAAMQGLPYVVLVAVLHTGLYSLVQGQEWGAGGGEDIFGGGEDILGGGGDFLGDGVAAPAGDDAQAPYEATFVPAQPARQGLL